MRSFIRLVLFACVLALVGLSPSRAQPGASQDGLSDRVAALESKVAELSARLDRCPCCSQVQARGAVVTAAPVVARGPLGFYREVCGPKGCTMVFVPQAESAPVATGTVTYSYQATSSCESCSSGPSAGQVLQERRGPVRRGLFGRWR